LSKFDFGTEIFAINAMFVELTFGGGLAPSQLSAKKNWALFGLLSVFLHSGLFSLCGRCVSRGRENRGTVLFFVSASGPPPAERSLLSAARWEKARKCVAN
jgi:hypothetical protein